MSDNNGWILTSERLPTENDCLDVGGQRGPVYAVRCTCAFAEYFHQINESHVAWRPIDPPPAFVMPVVYRDVKFPEDYGKACECSDLDDFSIVKDALVAGFVEGVTCPFWVRWKSGGQVGSRCYPYARIKVDPC